MMKTLVQISIAVLTILLASGASAQDTADTTGTENFPIGTAPEVPAGQSYAAEVHDDWELICVKVETGNEPCEIGQLVVDEQGNPISDIRVFPLPPGGQAIAGSTVVTPLGVLLQAGLTIIVDDNPPKQYPFTFCNNVGCVARIGFTPVELQRMRKGAIGSLQVRLFNNPDNLIVLPISFKGFSAAYTSLSKRLIAQTNP